jgi:hypothetical protein
MENVRKKIPVFATVKLCFLSLILGNTVPVSESENMFGFSKAFGFGSAASSADTFMIQKMIVYMNFFTSLSGKIICSIIICSL